MAQFWMDHMKPLCVSIHLAPNPDIPSVYAFFTPSDWIIKHRDRVTLHEYSLDLQTFCNLLTPRLYWLHFKHITLPNITKTSTEYLHTANMPATAQRLWFNWCRNFDTALQHLSVRFYMEQKAERIRLRMAA